MGCQWQRAVACRGLVMPGATAWSDAPLPNFSIQQWRMVVMFTGCLWRHNMTSYSRLQTNVLEKFVDTTCIFRDAGAAVGKQSRRYGGPFVDIAPQRKLQGPQIELWSTKNRWSLIKFQNVNSPEQTQPPIENFLATVLMGRGISKTVEGNGNIYIKIVTNYICFCSSTMLTSKIIT